MSKELIERMREAAAQRVASTAMIGAADLSVAADVLEQTEAARMAAISRLCEAEVACATACQERDALAAELKALRARAIELEAETKSSEEMQTLKFCEREWSTERAAMMNTIHALRNCGDALAAELKALLEQEPVAWVNPSYAEPAQGCTYSREDHERWPHIYSQPLYAHPVPARELTDETIQRHWDEACKDTPQTPGWSRHIRFARAIERYLKGVSENG